MAYSSVALWMLPSQSAHSQPGQLHPGSVLSGQWQSQVQVSPQGQLPQAH